MGKILIGDDPIELGCGLIHDRAEGLAAVEGNIGSAVIRLNHPVGIVVRDPRVVIVSVTGRDGFDGVAAVDRAIETGVQRAYTVSAFFGSAKMRE
jgi:hypothetical protein